jgi:hypothetical protein
MRSTFLYLLVTLIVQQAAATGVLVQPPSVSLVPLHRVHEACGSEGDFDACTLFVAYRLEATCHGQSITATVTFRPLILLHNIHQLSHEKLHIEDIRGFATAYVSDIEQNAFETPSQCQAEALAAERRFAETMRGFARHSNAVRHPTLRSSR